MSDEIKCLIDNHLDILSRIIKSSEGILHLSKSCEIEELYRETQNRDRLLNILEEAQVKIQKEIEDLQASQIKKEVVDLIKNWQMKMNNQVELISNIDEQIVDLLDCERTNITKEISELYKKKQSFKGYNLKNVQR